MSNKEKIDAVLQHCVKGSDKNNIDREKYVITEEMKGNLQSSVKSYDLKDNPKYQTVEYLITLLDEQFGLNNKLIHELRTPADFSPSLIEMNDKKSPAVESN